MNRKEAISQLESMRDDAEGNLLIEARDGDVADSIWAADVEALTAGIQALEARDPDRTGRMRRDSKMLEQILEAIKPKVRSDDRRIFAALVQYWQDGRKAATPVELVALEEQGETWEFMLRNRGGFGTWDEIVAQIALLLLADVHPEAKKEAKKEAGTDDKEK